MAEFNVFTEEEIIEAYLNGENLETLTQEPEDVLTKNTSRAARRKKGIAKNRRKKMVFDNMSPAQQEITTIDFWDGERSHGRSCVGSGRKAFLKKHARKAARRTEAGSGKSGYKRSYDLGWDLL